MWWKRTRSTQGWFFWQLVCFAVGLALVPSLARAEKPILLKKKVTHYQLLYHMSVLIERGKPLSLEDLTSEDFAEPFHMIQGPPHSLYIQGPNGRVKLRKYSFRNGKGDITAWLKIPLQVSSSIPVHSRWIFHVDIFRGQPLTVYQCTTHADNPQQLDKCKLAGMPWSANLARASLLQLQRLPGKSKQGMVLLVRLSGKLTLSWHLRHVRLWQLDHYIRSKRLLHAYVGVYFGVILLIVFISFFFFLFQRDRSYLWYTLFQLSVAAYLFLDGPLGWEYLSPYMSVKTVGFVSGMMLASMMFWLSIFSQSFLRTRELTPMVHWMFWAVAGAATTLFVGLLLGWNVSSIPRIMALTGPFLVMFAGLLCWRRGYKPARYYFVGQTAFVASTFVLVMEGNGYLPYTGLGTYWMYIGSFVEAILLSLALLERMRFVRRERNELVSAKQWAETTARQQEQRLKTALSAFNGGIWDWDIPSERMYVSPKFLSTMGYDPVVWDFTLVSWVSLIHPEDAEDVTLKLQTHLTQPNATSFEAEFRLKTTEGWRWILGQGSTVEFAKDNTPARMVGTFIDITQRRKEQERMARADRMASLGQLLTGVAHEINNPNNFITFNLPLLKKALESLEPALEEYSEDNPGWRITNMPYGMFLEETYKLIENMRYGATRITTIVSELKSFVRSHEKHDKAPVDIEKIVERVMTLVGKKMEQLVSSFEVTIEPEIPQINANAGKMEQVLINLLLNAGQACYGKDDSFVRLNISQVDTPFESIKIEIEDNGAGIPKDLQMKIFDPFVTTKATDEGTGLGLAISHQIIEDHGGQISVESEVYRGTCFTVLVPQRSKTEQLLSEEPQSIEE